MLIMDEYDVNLGIIRSERNHPPAHYLVKINPYSSFASDWTNGYSSDTFHAGGYNWCLVLYPLGKNKADEHISLYLRIEETENLPAGWEVLVHFKLFVHDQINDKYLVIQDVRHDLKRFYPAKKVWGFEEVLPMQIFKDINKGYLVNDCCSFGAEVFVIPKTRKYEFVRSLTPSEENNNKRFTWKLGNFSKNTQSFRSQVFTTLDDDEDIKWSFVVSYVARGSDSIRNYDDDYLSLRLVSEHKDLPLGIHVYAQFTLRVKAQIDSKLDSIERQAKNWFSTGYEDFGWDHFASMGELQPCISDNTLIVECDINKLTLAYKEDRR
ncbi:hypothetical protein K1719_026094 [Acacia pycnantha]|nr:hypothetical protein K1719_026094 [Acacia pycnantha]